LFHDVILRVTIVFFGQIDIVDELGVVLEQSPGQGEVGRGLHEEADVEGCLAAEASFLDHPAAFAEQVRS